MYTEIEELKGKTFTSVEQIRNDEILFTCEDGSKYRMMHQQDCCESVTIESITGDLQDLVGSPILLAEEATSDVNPENANEELISYQDSFTWTFYKLATLKGYVDIRWYGESNGYYSEGVDICKVD